MKNFLKILLSKNNIILTTVFLLAVCIRFYNFPNRITFWSEQARSLVVSANYLKKPSLLGQPYFIREDTNSHVLYSGALFNYSLIPLILVSGYDPVSITIFFTLLNIFTGLLTYLLVKKMFNTSIALAASILFLFNDWMVYHSLFIWSYNFLPLIGILIFYFGWRFLKNRKTKNMLILGFLSGLGVGLQFLFLPIALVIFLIGVLKSKRKMIDATLFIFGAASGNLPMILFDLRHNFYESHTLIQYFIDTLAGKSNASPAYYYFLPFWPMLAVAGAFIVIWLWKKSKLLSVLVLILYLFLNLTSNQINWKAPTGMPEGLKTADINKASWVIANDAKGNFNVAEVLDFDKRAYILRYYLEFKYGKKPLDEISYQNLKLLYVLARDGYNFNKSDIWEINAGGPYNISLLEETGQGYAIYKLQK